MEDWLKSVGLEHRIEIFRAHGITLDQIVELTEADLRELGLTIGERKRFRRAAAALPQPADLPEPAPGAPLTIAEHRPLTVMFVDLVDSSGMAEELEPEDLLEVTLRYRDFCGAAIRRFGGHMSRVVGDGILAYFCYPLANENDPERAVRAALEITAGIGGLATPATRRLAVRIGIATGRVIISDLFAGGAADKQSIMGSTPNLAARLQSFAPSSGIVIAEETYARVASVFACEDMGSREIRGMAGQRRVWRVLHEWPRDAAMVRPERMTPLYGRETEVAELGRAWQRAAAGSGGLVLLTGEAGIGKSRMVEAFLEGLPSGSRRIVQLAGSAFDIDSPLQPVIGWLRHGAALDAATSPEERLARLEAFLSPAGRQPEMLGILCGLLGISGPPAPSLPPPLLRERTLSILLAELRALGSDNPACLIVEDAHWLDPTTLELLQRLTPMLPGLRLLLLISARREFEAPWITGAGATVLPLARLRAEDVTEMVRCLSEREHLPEALVRQIIRRADGVPLFVEEVVRTLLERRQLPPGGRVVDDMGEGVPASVYEILMSRLDRAGLAKEVAQIAAVIGRSVRRDVLAEVADLGSDDLEHPLAMLLQTGVLLREAGHVPDSYVFSHTLLRDAAESTLLRDRRQALHLRVARALQRLDPEGVERQPEILALHLTEGECAAEAVPHWLEAGRRSINRSALIEATRLLQRGLAAVERLEATDVTLDLRLQIISLLGPALIGLKGPGSFEAQELYGGAFAMSVETADERKYFPIFWGWWRLSRDFTIMDSRARRLLERARLRQDPELLLQAHHCNWASCFHKADLPGCCEHAKAGLEIYAKHDFAHHASLYGNHDAKVCAHGELAQVYWMQGRLRQALDQERLARQWADRLDHLGSLVHAQDTSLIHHAVRRDHREVYERAGALMRLTAASGLADHEAKGLIFRGWAMALGEDPGAGLPMLEEGLARQKEIGTEEDFPIYLAFWAQALIAADQPARAVEMLQGARANFEAIGLTNWAPELERMFGEAVLAADPARAEDAAAAFAEAARLARTQGAAMLELRVAVSAARLDRQLGREEEGAARLEAALAGVVEDDGGPDLTEARELLLHLQPTGRLRRRWQ